MKITRRSLLRSLAFVPFIGTVMARAVPARVESDQNLIGFDLVETHPGFQYGKLCIVMGIQGVGKEMFAERRAKRMGAQLLKVADITSPQSVEDYTRLLNEGHSVVAVLDLPVFMAAQMPLKLVDLAALATTIWNVEGMEVGIDPTTFGKTYTWTGRTYKDRYRSLGPWYAGTGSEILEKYYA